VLSSPGVLANKSGVWCFRATYTPTGTIYTGSSDNTHGECVTVNKAPTTTVTTPSDGSGVALVSPVPLGTVLFDKAVVTGVAAGGNPTGTVDFFLCDPTQVTGPVGAEVCAAGTGTALAGNPRTLSPDAGSDPPTSSVLSSPGIAANKAGVWCFRATYTPTGTTYTGSSDNSHGECVTVDKAPTTTVTTPSVSGAVPVNTLVNDHAVVTGSNADGFPTGMITFFICNPFEVTGGPGSEVCATGGTQVGLPQDATPILGSSPPQTEATSADITANAVGVWCFRAEYVPGGANGGNYLPSSDATHGECFLVGDSTAAASEQNWLPNDSATITSTGDTNLDGTLSFTLYSGDNCGETSGSILIPAEVFTLTNADSPATRNTTNGSFKVTASATVSWKVVFTSSNPNVTGSSRCEVTSLVITN